MEKLGVGVIGCGMISGNHFHALEKLGNVALRAVCDIDEEKWGTMIEGIEICTPEILREKESYRNVIITVQKWVSIYNSLRERFGITDNYIWVFDMPSNSIVTCMEAMDLYRDRLQTIHIATDVIKVGLLNEASRNREFDGYEGFVIHANAVDYEIIKNYLIENMSIECKFSIYQSNMSIAKTDKVIIAGASYLQVITEVRKKVENQKQWILLPLFNVENSIVF